MSVMGGEGPSWEDERAPPGKTWAGVYGLNELLYAGKSWRVVVPEEKALAVRTRWRRST